jgi:hypothetical protein
MINRQFGIGWEYLHVNDTWRVAYPARRWGPTVKVGPESVC